jgi:hypothetical protein
MSTPNPTAPAGAAAPKKKKARKNVSPYHIPPQAAALVNGEPADVGRRLEAGDVLEFARAAGEKGARP